MPKDKALVWKRHVNANEVTPSFNWKQRKDTSQEHKHSDEEWRSYKKKIEDLYDTYNIKEVARLMAEREGFHASLSQYQHRLKGWGRWKYLTLSNENMEYIKNEVLDRLLAGKTRVAARLHGKKISGIRLSKVLKNMFKGAEEVSSSHWYFSAPRISLVSENLNSHSPKEEITAISSSQTLPKSRKVSFNAFQLQETENPDIFVWQTAIPSETQDPVQTELDALIKGLIPTQSSRSELLPWQVELPTLFEIREAVGVNQITDPYEVTSYTVAAGSASTNDLLNKPRKLGISIYTPSTRGVSIPGGSSRVCGSEFHQQDTDFAAMLEFKQEKDGTPNWYSIITDQRQDLQGLPNGNITDLRNPMATQVTSYSVVGRDFNSTEGLLVLSVTSPRFPNIKLPRLPEETFSKPMRGKFRACPCGDFDRNSFSCPSAHYNGDLPNFDRPASGIDALANLILQDEILARTEALAADINADWPYFDHASELDLEHSGDDDKDILSVRDILDDTLWDEGDGENDDPLTPHNHDSSKLIA